jgi:hypothetical protein
MQPVLFKMGWVLLSFMPILFPDLSNELGYTVGAIMLHDVPLALIAFFINIYKKVPVTAR